MPGASLRMQPHIGVVIAGDGSDPVGGPEMMQPLGGEEKFLRQAEIDKIAGYGDVVRLPLDEIAGEHVEDIPAMHELSPTMPIDVSEHALA
jgi:hypothetical protein